MEWTTQRKTEYSIGKNISKDQIRNIYILNTNDQILVKLATKLWNVLVANQIFVKLLNLWGYIYIYLVYIVMPESFWSRQMALHGLIFIWRGDTKNPTIPSFLIPFSFFFLFFFFISSLSISHQFALTL